MLVDSTRILVPEGLREELLDRALVGHQGVNKTCWDIAEKYIWPDYKRQVAELCASCEACQRHGRSQKNQPMRLALEHVTRPMTSVGLDLYAWKGTKNLVMVDHFSGLPFTSRMTKTTAEAVTKQLTKWWNMYGGVRYIRTDCGPPFSSAAFADYCKA